MKSRRILASLAAAGFLIRAVTACGTADLDASITPTSSGGPGGGLPIGEPPARCSVPEPGCPCPTDGASANCGKQIFRQGDSALCGEGLMTCQRDTWGECIINHSITTKMVPRGGLQIQNLGGPTACSDPCSLGCVTFPDTTAGLDGGGGLAIDGGITGVPSADAGVVAPPACMGGPTEGTCAHNLCSAGTPLTAACSSCTGTVCGNHPECCTTAWSGACIAWMRTECNRGCAVNNMGGCIVCYRDNIDHDGDGYSYAQGDCADCDPTINPGAFDFADGVDNDCDGTIDNPITSCDSTIALNTTVADNFPRAMGLCKFTDLGATGAAKTWGVINGSTSFRQIDMVQTPPSISYGVLPNFGTGTANDPREGLRHAAFSSGTARRPTDTGFVFPNGGGSNHGTAATPPAGFPKNRTGCPIRTDTYDSSGIVFRVRVPTNANSFSFNLNFFSSEYPEWVCTAYNDSFFARLFSTHPLIPLDRNISFDNMGNPVNVNVGFFSIPGGPAIYTHPGINGTGHDGNCGGQVCGGASGWLVTTAPVVPGEVITMHYSIWDTGDHQWDSTVLLDNWRWFPQTATVSTLPDTAPPVLLYTPATFIREYDLGAACPTGQRPRVGLWSWTSTTPGDSQIEFSIRAANNLADLDTAMQYPLQFSNPPGPVALDGQNAIARTAPTNTTNGSANVEATLLRNNLLRYPRALRVYSRLVPTTNQLAMATLATWNLGVSCEPDE